MLRDMVSSAPAMPTMAQMHEVQESDAVTPFPEMTPPGMAYVPLQQWEEPYDPDTAFPIGTIFPALNFPYRGGAGCV